MRGEEGSRTEQRRVDGKAVGWIMAVAAGNKAEWEWRAKATAPNWGVRDNHAVVRVERSM
jgi:hypothetical protein